MRSRVLFSLCLTGLLLACVRGGARSTASSEAVSADSEPVESCNPNPSLDGGGVPVFITATDGGKVHLSTTTVDAGAGETVNFVSQVTQSRCFVVANAELLVSGSQNPLLVPACETASWALISPAVPMQTDLWNCATSDSDCSKCKTQGPAGTINGKLDVTSSAGP